MLRFYQVMAQMSMRIWLTCTASYVAYTFAMGGLSTWGPTLLQRKFVVSSAQAGAVFGGLAVVRGRAARRCPGQQRCSVSDGGACRAAGDVYLWCGTVVCPDSQGGKSVKILSVFAHVLARLWFRTLQREGPALPPGPVLLVLNHPNGLLDPLIATALLDPPPRFLAKATLWKIWPLKPFLRLFNLIPVQRPQTVPRAK